MNTPAGRLLCKIVLLQGGLHNLLELQASSCVADLKRCIDERWDLPVVTQRLVVNGMVLEDDDAILGDLTSPPPLCATGFLGQSGTVLMLAPAPAKSPFKFRSSFL